MIHVVRNQMKKFDYPPNKEVLEHENEYLKKFQKELQNTIGWSGVDLEARDEFLRKQETNFGNLLADLMRTEYQTDFAIVNTGSIRLNQLIPAGAITAKTLQSIFPFPDTMVVLKMPGSIFKEAMEQAVSKYPELDGRFPAISGFKLQFDPSKPVNDRISSADIKPDAQEELNMNELYTVALNSYLAKGLDGFAMLKKQEVQRVTDDENSLWVIDLVKQFLNRTQKDFVPAP